jgi:hypothetical protein
MPGRSLNLGSPPMTRDTASHALPTIPPRPEDAPLPPTLKKGFVGSWKGCILSRGAI